MPGDISGATGIAAAAIRAAAARIRGATRWTTLRHSPALSALAGRDVFLKLETEQITGSFKLRGAFNTIAALPTAMAQRGVVTASAGNHGLGVAYAAKHFRIAATVFVPRTAPIVKREGIGALGATLDATAPDYDAALQAAMEFAGRHGQTFVHPCLGRDLLAGQGTVALEILTDLPDTRTLVTPVGGAGLLGGIASYMRDVAPRVRIVGVQSTETAAMARSLAAGHVVPIPHTATLADGLAGQIEDTALEIGRSGLDEMVLLSEAEIGAAIAWAAREERLTVEGAGVVALAALLHGKLPAAEAPVVAVVSGGNIDALRHAEVMGEHAAAAAR